MAHHTTPGMQHAMVGMQGPPMHFPQAQQQPQVHYQQQQKNQLQSFWQQQFQEMEQVNEFKNHQLPLARIKKIMKSDEDVKEEELGVVWSSGVSVAGDPSVPYGGGMYYPPMGPDMIAQGPNPGASAGYQPPQ